MKIRILAVFALLLTFNCKPVQQESQSKQTGDITCSDKKSIELIYIPKSRDCNDSVDAGLQYWESMAGCENELGKGRCKKATYTYSLCHPNIIKNKTLTCATTCPQAEKKIENIYIPISRDCSASVEAGLQYWESMAGCEHKLGKGRCKNANYTQSLQYEPEFIDNKETCQSKIVKRLSCVTE